MVLKAQENNLIIGFVADIIDKGVVVLQYVGDTIFCIKHYMEQAINPKLLLYMFDMMSGLKINYLKSEIVVIGGDIHTMESYSEIFNCQVGKLPMKYLGVRVTFSNLKNIDWISWMQK
jgi:hypothetical protein